MLRIVAILLVGFLGFIVPMRASAQPAATPATAGDTAQARRLYERGARAYEAQRYEEALTLFEGAHQLSQRPELLYNIGVSADEAHHNERALEAFRQYLETSPNAERRREVEVRISAIEARLRADQTQATTTQTSTTAPATQTSNTSNEATNTSPLATSPTQVDGPQQGGDVTGEWWFWTAIIGGAALIAGGVVVGVIAASDPQPDQPLVQSNIPGVGVIWALEGN